MHIHSYIFILSIIKWDNEDQEVEANDLCLQVVICFYHVQYLNHYYFYSKYWSIYTEITSFLTLWWGVIASCLSNILVMV